MRALGFVPAPSKSKCVTTAPAGTGRSNSASPCTAPGLTTATSSVVVAMPSTMRKSARTQLTLNSGASATVRNTRACGNTTLELQTWGATLCPRARDDATRAARAAKDERASEFIVVRLSGPFSWAQTANSDGYASTEDPTTKVACPSSSPRNGPPTPNSGFFCPRPPRAYGATRGPGNRDHARKGAFPCPD